MNTTGKKKPLVHSDTGMVIPSYTKSPEYTFNPTKAFLKSVGRPVDQALNGCFACLLSPWRLSDFL